MFRYGCMTELSASYSSCLLVIAVTMFSYLLLMVISMFSGPKVGYRKWWTYALLSLSNVIQGFILFAIGMFFQFFMCKGTDLIWTGNIEAFVIGMFFSFSCVKGPTWYGQVTLKHLCSFLGRPCHKFTFLEYDVLGSCIFRLWNIQWSLYMLVGVQSGWVRDE